MAYSVANSQPTPCDCAERSRSRRSSHGTLLSTDSDGNYISHQIGCDACVSPLAERFRQALIGYDNLPPKREKQHLRIYVHHTHDRSKLYLGGSEFQSLLNLLPMATVCTEARVHAATLCRANIQSIDLCCVEDSPPVHNHGGMEILQPILPQQTTATIITACDEEDGPKGFDCAEHLVDIVHRVFGDGVKRIVLTSWFHTRNSLEEIYWPHSPQIMDMQFK